MTNTSKTKFRALLVPLTGAKEDKRRSIVSALINLVPDIVFSYLNHYELGHFNNVCEKSDLIIFYGENKFRHPVTSDEISWNHLLKIDSNYKHKCRFAYAPMNGNPSKVEKFYEYSIFNHASGSIIEAQGGTSASTICLIDSWKEKYQEKEIVEKKEEVMLKSEIVDKFEDYIPDRRLILLL